MKFVFLFGIILVEIYLEGVMFDLMGRTIWQFFSESVVVIIGLALIALGVAIGFLSRRITRAVRHNNNVESNDKLFLTLKIVGMALVIAGFICVAVELIIYFATRTGA